MLFRSIDEMGYVQQSREEMEVLFTLLSERYERGSVLLTSNLPFSKWEGIFKDPMTTAAAIDRLVHHSVIVELNIPSYRMEEAKKNRDPAPENNPANCCLLYTSLRDSAIVLVGFAGEFRRSELALINICDLKFSADGIVVTVRKSKTDQESA